MFLEGAVQDFHSYFELCIDCMKECVQKKTFPGESWIKICIAVFMCVFMHSCRIKSIVGLVTGHLAP